jgi:ribosome biogenesis GTPase
LIVSLARYGWDESFSRAFSEIAEAALVPGRVVLASSGSFRVALEDGEAVLSLSGRFRHRVSEGGSLPAVGDWVAVDPKGARIEALVPRRTKLSRKEAGRKSREQVVAANVDLVAVTMGLDADFNPRRLERFLSTVWESGAVPVVLLTKLDLCEDEALRRSEIEDVAAGVEVIASSALDGRGLDRLRALLKPGKTAVLVGSSGVGKSTIINRLLGEEIQKTLAVRTHDSRGRHATSHRELFLLPGGALLIDSPGVREIQLFSGGQSLERAFQDVSALAAACRFSDCKHGSEPGCAVREAVNDGRLGEDRLESFRALEKELLYLERRTDQAAQRALKQKWRAIHREMRRSGRHRRT